MSAPRAMLSWSSGKDSAFALHVAREKGLAEIVCLLTTVNEVHERVAIHGVRRDILRAQQAASGLPMIEVPLPHPCGNAIYEERMGAAMAAVAAEGVTHAVFGDLFLADIRAYRERQLGRAAMRGLFPLWGMDTARLALEMIDRGLVAHVATLDPAKLPKALCGSRFDRDFLKALPEGVDPCGENGEFHTIVSAGPFFARPLDLVQGETVERDGFVYTDFRLADA